VGPFGVMGGFMQPQAHVQVISSAVDFGLNPQDILDAPRWRWESGKSIVLESSVDPALAERLAKRGHKITMLDNSIAMGMGRGQIIWKMPNGTYCAGTEPRSDGAIACF